MVDESPPPGWPRWQRDRHQSLRRLLGAALLVGALLLVLGAWSFSSDLHCEAEAGDSNFGKAEWSWFPVGTTCRWSEELNGFDQVEDPGWLPTIVIGGLVLTGLGLLLRERPSGP